MGVQSLSREEFETMIRRELREYVQRNIASSLRTPSNTEAKNLLGALKMVMLDVRLGVTPPAGNPRHDSQLDGSLGSAATGQGGSSPLGAQSWGWEGAAGAWADRITCEGWVHKRGNWQNPTFQQRWMTLASDGRQYLLRYYKNRPANPHTMAQVNGRRRTGGGGGGGVKERHTT